jgi:hypothetical protein
LVLVPGAAQNASDEIGPSFIGVSNRQAACPPSSHHVLEQRVQLSGHSAAPNEATALQKVSQHHAQTRDVKASVKRLLQKLDDAGAHRHHERFV